MKDLNQKLYCSSSRTMRWMWFFSGLAAGIATVSIAMASVPQHSAVTDDTAIYQELSEIRVPRASRPDFDGDISRLSAVQPRFREKLPSLQNDPRIRNPMNRLAQRKYQYSGGSTN